MRLAALPVLILTLLSACQHAAPLDKHGSQIKEIISLPNDGSLKQEYVQLNGTERMFEQTQWTKIVPLDSIEGYRHIEVYNVYEAANGRTEYYVSEFELHLNDTSRQEIIDYQAVITPDTAFTLLGVENNFKFAQDYEYEIEGHIFNVYKLLGYAHTFDKDPVHYKYWSPDFGTLMIYSGQNETFELEESRGEKEVIKRLLRRIKEEMGRQRM